MIFRQHYDPVSSTYTYVLGDEQSRQAVLIDPVYEQFVRDVALLRELGLTLVYTLETHVHADHVTAAWLCKRKLGSRVVVSAAGGADCADVLVADGDVVSFGDIVLEVRATPGHTSGCVTYVTADHKLAFTGDALLIRGAGRTDFQQGDAHRLYRSVHDKIFSLPDDCVLFPAHDYAGRTATTVAEEKRHNPRLGGARSEADFVGYMANLGLPHPKQIAAAVPANLRCGEPSADAAENLPAEVDWGPVVRTYAGVPTLEPDWVAQHLDALTVVDVREPDEFMGELGHIEGARLLPLGELRSRVGDLPRDKPIVTVCRSGGRSDQAAVILEKAGIDRVANVSGGMVAWHGLGLPVGP